MALNLSAGPTMDGNGLLLSIPAIVWPPLSPTLERAKRLQQAFISSGRPFLAELCTIFDDLLPRGNLVSLGEPVIGRRPPDRDQRAQADNSAKRDVISGREIAEKGKTPHPGHGHRRHAAKYRDPDIVAQAEPGAARRRRK